MDKISSVLESLAAQLGTTVEYLWPLLLYKERVDWAAGVLVSLFLLAVGLLLFKKSLKMEWWDYAELGPGAWLGIPAGLAMVSGTVGLFAHIATISNFLVPEAAVINNLMSII